ncbi:MAG: hypothetical protein J3Q66DRAFT_368781 [Benniella sp.]|nr:MAG: hypothetical protein J3Q66DRAFT_368781 [Benniella sp.]
MDPVGKSKDGLHHVCDVPALSLLLDLIPATSDELIHLNSIQYRKKLEPANTPSKMFSREMPMNAIDVVMKPPVKDIHGATLAGFKRHALPNATEPELDGLRIAIYHPDLPSFLPGSVERPNSDGHLRAILSKYHSIGLYDLALDLETPERKYTDYTVLDGRRRYGCPPDVTAKLPILIPLDWSDREAALQRLYAEVESRLKLKKLRPAAAVSCFFVHACSLFPALTLQFDEPMSSNQGQGTIDIAITSSVSTSCVVGFVTINKDFETALTWNMAFRGVVA